MNIETKTYSGGTTAAGPAPLPAQSPAAPTEAAILGMVEDYGQWLWDSGYMDNPTGETLVDDAASRREEIQRALQELVHHAYAEGREDEAEARERLPARRDLPEVDASYKSNSAYFRALGWNECLDAITGEMSDDEISRRYTRIGGGPNPFYRCVVCEASVPGVRNELAAHARACQ